MIRAVHRHRVRDRPPWEAKTHVADHVLADSAREGSGGSRVDGDEFGVYVGRSRIAKRAG